MRTLLLLLLTLWPAAAAAEPLREALGAYALYQQDISDLLDADVRTPEAIDLALQRAARHDPGAVTRGWMAYGALTAAQSPAFVAGVRSRVRAAGRAPVIRQLNRDVTYARRRPPGSAEAVRLILAMASTDSGRIADAGERYRFIANELDISAWPPLTNHDERWRRMRAGASGRAVPPELAEHLDIGVLSDDILHNPGAFGGARFWDAIIGREAPAPQHLTLSTQRSSAADQMLTLAGLYVVGATESEHARVDVMLNNAAAQSCLALEQLEFRQCVSVSHDGGEDAHCLARHGLTETSACFASSISAP